VRTMPVEISGWFSASSSHASTAMDPAVLARLPEVDIPLPDLHCSDQLLSEVSA
jgi:hypothetical protein